MKKFLCSLVAIFAIFLLVGCGGTNSDKIEITFWHAMGQDKQKTIQKMIDSFEEKYDNVKVTQSPQGNYSSLLQKVNDNLKAGAGPVIAQTYPDHVVSYLTSNGAVVDLTDYAFDAEVGFDAQGVDTSKFVKSFWDEGYKYDDMGSLYSMPFNKSTESMYYNKTIFSKYDWFVGLLGFKQEDVYSSYEANSTNEDGTLKVGKKVYRDDFIWEPTWEQIIKIADAYKTTTEYSAPEKDANGKDQKVARYALGYDSEDNLFITLTQQMAALDENKTYGERGEDAYVRINPTTRKGEFTFLDSSNPYPRRAVEWYNENYKANRFATASAFSADYCSDYFVGGRVIMTIGSTAGASHNDPGDAFQVGVATYPQFEAAKGNQRQVIQQGTNLTLFSQRDKEVEKYGWLFILWMTNYENSYLWAKETSYFPSRSDVYESTEYQDFLLGKEETADGQVIYETNLTNQTIVAGWKQSEYFFTNVVFNGTDVARSAGEGIITSVLANTASMDKAFADAKDALKNYIAG